MKNKKPVEAWEKIIDNGVAGIAESYRDKQTDGPWDKIGDLDKDKELTSEERSILLKNSRDRYFQTPEGRSLIESAKHYVIGTGIVYTADDENPIVQEKLDEFWNHPKNIMELRQKEIVTRGLRDGEVFIRFFKEAGTGMTYVRCIEPEQIQEIKTKPNDAEDIISYIRKWVPKGLYKEETEMISANEIVHIKLGADLNMARGRPYLEPIIKRLIQLEQFIEGRVRKNRIASGFILEKILKGPGATSDKVSSVTGDMDDAKVDSGSNQTASKKMPKFGSVVVHNEAIEYKWCNPEIRADDSSEDARLIKLSICAGVNAPEYLLSDASNANYSSTMVAENPYVRSMEDFQDTFKEYFRIIFTKVIETLMAARAIPKMSTETVVKEKRIGKYIPKIGIKLLQKLREAIVDKEVTEPIKTKTSVTIDFPQMIHKELKADTEALQIHGAMGWASNRTLAGKFGYDYDEEVKEMDKERIEQEEKEPPEDEFAKDRDKNIEGNIPELEEAEKAGRWKVEDVDNHVRDLNMQQKKAWVKIANRIYRYNIQVEKSPAESEGIAIQTANQTYMTE